MRKSNNFKNQNRKLAEHNTIAQIKSRKLLDANEKYIIYAGVASVEVHTHNFIEKMLENNFEIDIKDILKKLKRFQNTCLRFLERFNQNYNDISEEKVKTGMTMYIQLLAHFRNKNYQIEKIEKLKEKYQEEKDLKVYYLELNYNYHIIDAILKDGKLKDQEWLIKYFHYWQIQLRAVCNWIEKEINSIDVKTA